MTSIPIWKHKLRLIAKYMTWLVYNPKIWLMTSRDRRFYLGKRKASIKAMIKIFELQQSYEKFNH